MQPASKPNCYGCVHRGSAAGGAHSQCRHPSALSEAPYALLEMVGLTVTPSPHRTLAVKGNPHGIVNGWFAWPFDYDPIWLLECNGYKGRGSVPPSTLPSTTT